MAFPNSSYVPTFGMSGVRPRQSGWELPDLARLSRLTERYGSDGRPGYAAVNFPTTGMALMPPSLVRAAQVRAGNPGMATPTPSVLPSAVPTPPVNPMLTPAAPVSPTGAPPPGMSTATKATLPDPASLVPQMPQNEGYLDSVTGGPPAVVPPPVPGRATVSTGRTVQQQTERYYDRKFSRNSKDPATRMQARRIDATAPLVDGSNNLRSSPDVLHNPNPVTFPGVNGHSEWSPY